MNNHKTCIRITGASALLGALVLLGGLFFAAAAAVPPRAGSTPNLGGTWKMNTNKSDNPREKIQEAMGDSGAMQSGRGGGGWGQRHGGGQSGRGGDMMNDFSQLTIVQNGSDIKVTGESGRTLAVLPADASASSNSGSDTNSNDQYAPPAPTVHWQGSQLIAEMDRRDGGKTTRTYELSADGKELYVTTRVENPRFSQPVTYRLVYDPAKSN
jgi:hypothetical protein